MFFFGSPYLFSHIFVMMAPASSEVWADPSVQSAVMELQDAEKFLSPAESPTRRSNDPLEALTGTLDESVWDTIWRDLRQIGLKIGHVMMPYESQVRTLDHLRDWDLWGPLIIGLFLSVLLTVTAEKDQAQTIFSQVFAILWVGAAVVTLNAALLGGVISFWQSVCVLGYSSFPLCVARAACLLVQLIFGTTSGIVRILIVLPALIWCTKVSVLFVGEVIADKRRVLAVYPVVFFYTFLAWMVVVV